MKRYKKEGESAYKARKSGRPSTPLNKKFIDKVVSLRKSTDYGSEKLHYVLKKEGFSVSQRQIQKVLDFEKLTDPCPKRRGQRKYVRYQWPISNYMWHCDWSEYKGEWYLAYIDDRSRRIMAAAKFERATESNANFLLYQAILMNETCLLSFLVTKVHNSTIASLTKKENSLQACLSKNLPL